MNFTFITAFPEMFESPLSLGLVGQAVKKSIIHTNFINPRDFTNDIHQTIDDKPFGGGDGMLMLAEPAKQALMKAESIVPNATKVLKIHTSPQGKRLDQGLVKDLASYEHLIFFCSRYAGLDERFVSKYIDIEISIGDYILSGGELAALTCLDAVARWIPGVLGNKSSALEDSFHNNLLECPQYTKPRDFESMSVPDILLSGNHKKIDEWKTMISFIRTAQRRVDLLEAHPLLDDLKFLKECKKLFQSLNEEELKVLGLNTLYPF